MFHSTLLLAIFLATIFCKSAYSQCSMIPVSLDERINEAVLVVEGKIINSYPLWNSNKSEIYTLSEIEVFKVFKGENFSGKINLVTTGGQIGDEMVMELCALVCERLNKRALAQLETFAI